MQWATGEPSVTTTVCNLCGAEVGLSMHVCSIEQRERRSLLSAEQFIERWYTQTIVSGGDIDQALTFAQEIVALRRERDRCREAIQAAYGVLGEAPAGGLTERAYNILGEIVEPDA